jgi:hypothetical protein
MLYKFVPVVWRLVVQYLVAVCWQRIPLGDEKAMQLKRMAPRIPAGAVASCRFLRDLPSFYSVFDTMQQTRHLPLPWGGGMINSSSTLGIAKTFDVVGEADIFPLSICGHLDLFIFQHFLEDSSFDT